MWLKLLIFSSPGSEVAVCMVVESMCWAESEAWCPAIDTWWKEDPACSEGDVEPIHGIWFPGCVSHAHSAMDDLWGRGKEECPSQLLVSVRGHVHLWWYSVEHLQYGHGWSGWTWDLHMCVCVRVFGWDNWRHGMSPAVTFHVAYLVLCTIHLSLSRQKVWWRCLIPT